MKTDHAAGSRNGFTLIEVVFTIVVMAVAAMVIFAYLSTTVSKSSQTIVWTRDLAEAKQEMEKYAARYVEDYLKTGRSSQAWENFKSQVPADPDFEVLVSDVANIEAVRVKVVAGDQSLSTVFTR